ncbi:MAG TPA: hypothetical protein VFX12_09970 [Vicinamibacterales bacterium]|nr:hypothetical protein [Vicinamibacterales bacterium]
MAGRESSGRVSGPTTSGARPSGISCAPGITERVAMAMTGHRTPSVFQRDNIGSDGDLRDAARKLDAAVGR